MCHMERESYKYRIVNELLKENDHVRSLAKKLKTNHMMVLRKMKELFKSNIVDYKEKGKNKVYFLKKTPEARNFIFMTENYRLIELVKKYPLLRKVIENIQNNQKIKLAVIFGSYAKETAGEDSDIDVYIETANKKIKSELELIDSKISVKTGWYDKANNLIKEIEKNHIIIKGVEAFYEKNKFFD